MLCMYVISALFFSGLAARTGGPWGLSLPGRSLPAFFFAPPPVDGWMDGWMMSFSLGAGGKMGEKKGWWFGRCSAFGDCVCHVLGGKLRSVAIGIKYFGTGAPLFYYPITSNADQ